MNSNLNTYTNVTSSGTFDWVSFPNQAPPQNQVVYPPIMNPSTWSTSSSTLVDTGDYFRWTYPAVIAPDKYTMFVGENGVFVVGINQAWVEYNEYKELERKAEAESIWGTVEKQQSYNGLYEQLKPGYKHTYPSYDRSKTWFTPNEVQDKHPQSLVDKLTPYQKAYNAAIDQINKIEYAKSSNKI